MESHLNALRGYVNPRNTQCSRLAGLCTAGHSRSRNLKDAPAPFLGVVQDFFGSEAHKNELSDFG
jgi:hypothetical protein